MNKSIVLTGSIVLVLSIILGAMAAHALEKVLPPDKIASFETGVRYAMYHGLAFLILGLGAEKLPKLTWVFRLLLAGVILFSGSIFFLALQPVLQVSLKFLGPVTPLGGVLMIAGWLLLTIGLIRRNSI